MVVARAGQAANGRWLSIDAVDQHDDPVDEDQYHPRWPKSSNYRGGKVLVLLISPDREANARNHSDYA